MDNLIQANVQLPMDLYARLIVQAQRHNTSVSEIVKRAVERYIADEAPEWPRKPEAWHARMETKG